MVFIPLTITKFINMCERKVSIVVDDLSLLNIKVVLFSIKFPAYDYIFKDKILFFVFCDL